MWEEFVTDDKYKKYFPTHKNVLKQMDKAVPSRLLPDTIIIEKETDEEKARRVYSELEQLHNKYKNMSSETLHEHFKTNPNEWEEYHKVSEENEKSFGGSSNIPVNVVIEYLKTKRNKKCKTIVDMGAGKNRLYTELHDNKKFKVIALDHVSSTKEVLCRNMKKTDIKDEEADYVVFCLSLSWCEKEAVEYLNEAYRILDDQGELIICESYKKWNAEGIKGEIVDILSPVLKEAGFRVSDEKIKEDGKFMYRVCKRLRRNL